jgi:nucleoredoxin
MPWLAIPTEEGSAAIKGKLAATLGVQGIPTLCILDAKTGEFITASARGDVEDADGDPEKAKEIVRKWKGMQRKPLSSAAGEMASAGPSNPLMKIVLFFAKNPIYIFALMYFFKFAKKQLAEWNGEEVSDVPPIVAEDEPAANTGPADDSEF